MKFRRVRCFPVDCRGIAVTLLLTGAAALGLGVTSYVFAPGYMSYDTIFQLSQALGREPLNDWHPPVMSLLWRFLIAASGSVASMAFLQQIIFWLALWLLSSGVWKVTRSLSWSLAVYCLAALPTTLNFVGVVWKDVQMAIVLLTMVALCLRVLVSRPRPWVKWLTFTLSTLLLTYATLVRKNSIFAILPLIALLFYAVFHKPNRRQLVVGATALALAILVPTVGIDLIAKPIRTHQATQIMLDDLLHVVGPTELARVDAPPVVREKLSTAARACADKKVLMDTYWACYGRGANGPFTAVAHPDDIAQVWLTEMPRHISGYLQYRARLFTDFLLHNRYFVQKGVHTNELGIAVDRPAMQEVLNSYVLGWQRNLPILFSGAFWLGLNVLLALRPGRSQFRRFVQLLGLSGTLYILGYIPIVPATDFRYVYWSAMTGALGTFLFLLGKSAIAQNHGERATVATTARDFVDGSTESPESAAGPGDT